MTLTSCVLARWQDRKKIPRAPTTNFQVGGARQRPYRRLFFVPPAAPEVATCLGPAL